MKITQSVRKHQNTVFFICFLFSAVFLLWRAKYGYIFNDEPFILTLGHRFLKGDKLFVHEWNMAQLISLFNMPIIFLYTKIAGTTVGLILFVRYVYVIWHMFVSGLLYIRVRRYGISAVLMVLYYLFFTPLDNMSITYNVMALSCMALFAVSFLRKRSMPLDILSGIALACAVLAQPYAVFVYFIYAAAVLVVNVTSLKHRPFAEVAIFEVRRFLCVTMGCAFSAACFMCYLQFLDFKTVIKGLLICFRAIQKGNPQMNHTLIELMETNPLQTTLGIIVLLISLADHKKREHKLLYFGIQAVVFIASVIRIVVIFDPILNRLMLPMSLLGLQAFVLTEKKEWNLFWSMWIVGIVFAGCANKASDTGVLAMSSASTVSGMGSILLIGNYWREYDNAAGHIRKRLGVVLLSVVMVQAMCQFTSRCIVTYWDSHIYALDTPITVGAAKGIYTTEHYARQYELVYEDLLIIRNTADEDSQVMLPLLFPSAYLDLDMNYGTNSTWTYTFNSLNYDYMIDRLAMYYGYYPEKIPDVIYVLQNDAEVVEHLNKVIPMEAYRREEYAAGTAYYVAE